MIWTFLFDTKRVGKVNQIFNSIQMVIVIIFLLNWMVSILVAFLTNLSRLLQYIERKMRCFELKNEAN
jgi:hypothetical protein